MSPFFGELYLRSTRPFQRSSVTLAEVEFLAGKLGPCLREGPVLDLGCGHGRHLGPLHARHGFVVGLDFDAQSVAEASLAAPVVRGDFFRLPFLSESLAAVFAWYNALFTFEDTQVKAILTEAARCLRPGGWLLVQCTHVELAMRQPDSTFDGPLPDGSWLTEECRFSVARQRDELKRTLVLPTGEVLEASFFIRYFALDGLTALLAEVGLEVGWACGGLDGRPVTAASADLIVGAQKRV